MGKEEMWYPDQVSSSLGSMYVFLPLEGVVLFKMVFPLNLIVNKD
jgi:hypothetical protein